jgi:hypothetical protein
MTVRQAMCTRDEGVLAHRSRLAEAGCKPPQAAGVKSSGRERCGKGKAGSNRQREENLDLVRYETERRMQMNH